MKSESIKLDFYYILLLNYLCKYIILFIYA